MKEAGSELTEKVVLKTIEMIEKICNSKDEKAVLSNGQEFYRGESHVLKIILDNPGIFSSEIARQFHVTRAVIHKMLKKLEERGLIQKIRDESDKKRFQLFVTSSGEECALELAQRQMAKAGAFFSCIENMTDSELETIIKFLDSSNEILDQR